MEYKPLKNKNYFQRFLTEFFPNVIVVAVISLIATKFSNLNFNLILILGYSIIWGIITHFLVRNSVYRIVINEENILVEGTKINKKWSESHKIENTQVRIKSKSFGRVNTEYFLIISFSQNTCAINKRKEWDYNDLIQIYNQISRDKPNPEDKELLEKVKLKAEGYSSIDIAFGKIDKEK